MRVRNRVEIDIDQEIRRGSSSRRGMTPGTGRVAPASRTTRRSPPFGTNGRPSGKIRLDAIARVAVRFMPGKAVESRACRLGLPPQMLGIQVSVAAASGSRSARQRLQSWRAERSLVPTWMPTGDRLPKREDGLAGPGSGQGRTLPVLILVAVQALSMRITSNASRYRSRMPVNDSPSSQE